MCNFMALYISVRSFYPTSFKIIVNFIFFEQKNNKKLALANKFACIIPKNL